MIGETVKLKLRSAKTNLAEELERFEYLCDSISNDLEKPNDDTVDFAVLLNCLQTAIELLLETRPYLFGEKPIEKTLCDQLSL